MSNSLEDHLAPFAIRSAQSRGRIFPDHDAEYRGLYQRDRDRVVHSSAFRRLQYKTQVFVSVMEGDYFRNRLTHTLEVTQIARTLARALGLNEDLTEALALSHDLGHGPFGHSGESALNELMQAQGGFDHNAQGLRIVDKLELRYTRFKGLNLTYETREGFVKNYSPDWATAGKLAPARRRSMLGFAGGEMPSLEVQLAACADEIAYDTHDLDDGLFAAALDDEQVHSVPLWRSVEQQVLAENDAYKSSQRLRRLAVVRRLIATLAGDLLNETRRRLQEKRIQSVADVRNCREVLVGFSAELEPQKMELESFLMDKFYSSPSIHDKTSLWQTRLKQLFGAYRDDPSRLPDDYRRRVESEGESLDRVICDYIAGMTDRYASKQWEKQVK